MTEQPKRVVVIGASTGGTIAANKIYKKAKKAKLPIEITVIDPTFQHVYQPGFLFTMFKKDKTRNLIKDSRKLLPKGTKTIEDKVVKLDTKEQIVTTEKGAHIPYDALVIATGAAIRTDVVDWWDDSIHHFYTPPAAERLGDEIEKFQGGKIVVAIADMPYKCPPAPIEACFLLDDYFKKKKMRDKVEITYASPLNRAFSIETANEKVQPLLEKKGINLLTYFNVDEVDTEEKVVYSVEGDDIDYDLLIMVPPHRGQEFLEEAGIAETGGWVKTDRYTLKVEGHDNIFALGDATNIPTSKAGSTAHYEAPILAANVVHTLKNDGKLEKYDGHVQCFFLTSFGRSLFLDFNYEKPPKPGNPSKFWWWFKLIFKPFYFRFVATGKV